MGMRVVGLFSGIGGIEHGLSAAGHTAELLCEIDPSAQRILRMRFPEVPVLEDIRRLPRRLPSCDLISAGFPCQDLSQAGRRAGISGEQSGLIDELLSRLTARNAPTWLMLENVPFMLKLDRGKAMQHLTDALVSLGFAWAYRVIDARAFGLPQRRKRVILLASRSEDPREVLFAGNESHVEALERDEFACGFYWTEGSTGLGWAVDAVPPLKGGSSVGIASPPGVWMQDGSIVSPDIRDAERLQGLPPDWTAVEVDGRPVRLGHRWKLVGNAVSVPLAKWVGDRLASPGAPDAPNYELLRDGEPWPAAAWGSKGKVFSADLTHWPVQKRYRHLAEFLRFPTRPLSVRAAEGFHRRAVESSLEFHGLREAVGEYLVRLQSQDAARRTEVVTHHA
jgi:DNA (cytosine-5)-methyltransferase 1